MSDFLMPSLGADMAAGTLVEWRVAPGDRVRSGDIVAVVETDKGAIEVEIFEEAVIAELCVPPGREVPVGTVLARLGGAAAAAAPVAPPMAARPAVPTTVPPPIVTPQARPSAIAGRVRATPAARRLAAELGIDLGSVHASGMGGAVCLADLERARGQSRPAPAAAARKAGFDPAAMRAAIAAAMGRSKREIPHYYLARTCDLGTALAWLEAANRQRLPADRLLPAVLLLKATGAALRKTPELNGWLQPGGFRPGDSINVGWAISLRGGGLVAPAIRDVDRRPLEELMMAMRDVVQRARSGGLRSSELSDATTTVTSLGERGAESVLPIIYPPQVAIIGFGRAVERPWVVDGRIVPRPLVTVTLAADHRVSDGHRGSLLLAEIDNLLQEPGKL